MTEKDKAARDSPISGCLGRAAYGRLEARRRGLSQKSKNLTEGLPRFVSVKTKRNLLLVVDGTKMEANANRYTFVWGKAVVKQKARLQEEVKAFIEVPDVKVVR